MIPHVICFVKLYLQQLRSIQFSAIGRQQCQFGKKLTILNFCGNIFIVEKRLLASPRIAKRGFFILTIKGTS